GTGGGSRSTRRPDARRSSRRCGPSYADQDRKLTMRTLDHQRTVVVGGPYFDRLTIGQVFEAAPTVTLTDGLAAAHRAIVGNRLRLTLDRSLAATVAGGPVAHPGLVTDIAIGQSTLATHHVI